MRRGQQTNEVLELGHGLFGNKVTLHMKYALFVYLCTRTNWLGGGSGTFKDKNSPQSIRHAFLVKSILVFEISMAVPNKIEKWI